MPLPLIPQNWTVRGDLPKLDPATASDDSLDLLDEDMVQIVDATETFSLDVGWYPAASRNGRFLCRAVSSEDWTSPIEELETRSYSGVFRWIESWVSEIQSRMGERGTFSNAVVTTVLLPSVISPAKNLDLDTAQPLADAPRIRASGSGYTGLSLGTRPQ